jgi:tyrosine-protein kinase Etk/Wzc
MSDKLIRARVADGPPPAVMYTPTVADHQDEQGFDVREMFHVLRRNAWLLVLLGAMSTGAMYYLLLKDRRQYRAEALIRVRDTEAEMTGGLSRSDGRQNAPIKADLPSELMVLKGRQVARAVVDREGLRLFDAELGAPSLLAFDVLVTLPAQESRNISVAFGANTITATANGRKSSAPYGQPLDLDGVRFAFRKASREPEHLLTVVPRERAVDWMIAALTARQSEGTDAITIAAMSPSRTLSIRVVNAVSEEYELANAARGRERNRRRRAFLVARLRDTDDSLVAAQTALGRFRSRTGVFGAREQFQAERTGATEAERQLQQQLADQRIRRSLVAQMGASERPTRTPAFRTLLASTDITSSPMVTQLFGRTTELERRRDELLTSGRPVDHPDVRQIETMLSSTETRLVEAIRTQASALDNRIIALGDVRQRAEEEVNRLTPTEGEEVRLTEQVEAMRGVGSLLRAELQRTRLAEAADLGQVEIVDRATQAVPMASQKPLKMALSLAFGLFLGVALALLRNHLDTGLHRRVDVEHVLRLPSLVIIPQLPRVTRWRRLFSGRRKGGIAHRTPEERSGRGGVPAPVVLPELVTVADATDSASGAYRALRTRLLFANNGTTLRSVVVTSAWAGEGKTTTAANLAVTLAQQGMRVLLVDCDLRQARLHTLFGLSNKPGMTDALRDGVPLDKVIQATSIERLFLLGSGAAIEGPAGPSELLGGKPMAALLATAREQFDMLVIDTPPVLLASDAAILSARADGALLVIRAGSTGRSLALDAVQQLTAVGAHVIGAVLNDPDAKTASNHEYGHKVRVQYSY